MGSLASIRYARALFSIAESQTQADLVEKDLSRAMSIVKQYSEIQHLVLNPTIPQTEKEDFVDKIFPSDITPLVIQFIKVLIKKGRFGEFATIQEEFHKLYEKKLGIQEVTAITAVPLSKENEDKLIHVLEDKFKSKIHLINEADPKIIGGLILRFNGSEINGGYKARLEEIKQALI